MAGARALALDTESDSLYHYFEKVCLIQLADPSGAVSLIDPLAVKDLSPLKPLLADPGVEKIFHAAEGDVSLLGRDFGIEFAGLFDTHLAGRLCGRLELGLQVLLERELGIRQSKSLQRCDWSRRPLVAEQERYAAGDVRHLVALRDRLREELRTRGRDAWAAEECEALARTPPAPHREPVDFMRIKGARDLGPRDLAVLRELVALREDWARRADLPLFKIAGDEALADLAVQRPRDQQGLAGLRGLSARFKERQAPQVLAALRRGESVPDADLPKRTYVQRERMTHVQSRRIDRLKAWRAGASPRVGLEGGVLLPQRLIERIAIDGPADLDALAKVPGIRRWRIGAFGAEILAAARP